MYYPPSVADYESVRETTNTQLSGSMSTAKTTPTFFKSLMDGSELLLSTITIITCLLLLFFGVINGSYTLSSLVVHMVAEIFHSPRSTRSRINHESNLNTAVDRTPSAISTRATLFLHRGVGEVCSVFVDLRWTWKEMIEEINLNNHTFEIDQSTKITWCGKTLKPCIPLMDYGIHNLSTLFIEDAGLKGGNPNLDSTRRDDDGDTDRRVSLF